MPQPSTPRDGLQSPEGPLLGAIEGPRGWSRRRVVAQIVGLLVSLSLLGWAISLALSDRNQASWEAMRSAHWSTVLTLIALSLLSLTLNGLMFWITLRPLRRLKPMEVVGVNAISTFLSVLPFKVGLATRVLIHHRRDGVPFRHIVAWMAGMGALALATLLPLAAAGLWRRDLDALWWLVAVGGLLLCNGVGVALGRIAKSRPWLARLSLGSHQIVRDPVAVGGHLLLRLLDIAILAGRFTAAAAIAGHALPPDQAILIATTYFLLSVLAPAGTLGFREAGVAALGLARGLDEGALALIALIVSVAEIASAAALAIPAAIVLRVDHLIAQKRPAPPSAQSGLVN
jgi:hypothetical protein